MIVFKSPPGVRLLLVGKEAARDGRRAVEGLIDGGTDWDEVRSSATLAASELVTNAIQAAGQCSLAAWFLPEQRAVRVEVADASPGRPRIRPQNDHVTGGHGLRIVAELSTSWGVKEAGSIKTVWFEIIGE
jgi:anti-sigma regulatory factor (Ser/Thr protein kinase)